ncbi:hypothetical protein N9242_01525 [Vicingaceae bacterium]|jgi:hypothetical protein|nr:hypothetical protein [Vicingaceae bacterium]
MKNSILILFLIFSTSIFSQDYLDDITLKTCECLGTIPDTLENQEFNLQLGLCMIEAADPYKKKIKKDLKIDLYKLDHKAGEDLGKVIGLKMASTCPDALLRVVNTNKKKTNSGNIIEGYITKIDMDKFITFSLRDENGKTTKFYWLTYIDSDFNLELNSQYKSLMNENVSITFEPQEFFDYRIEEYRTFNVIQKIESLD